MTSDMAVADARKNVSLRRAAKLCAACLAFDSAFAGAPWIGFIASVILVLLHLIKAAVAAFSDRVAALSRVKCAALFVATAALIMGAFVLQSKIAYRNAERIIAAAEAYRLEQWRYPGKLDDLVPMYLPDIPACAYRLLPCGYGYWERGGKHHLGWVENPPYGRPGYEFETKTWLYLDR